MKLHSDGAQLFAGAFAIAQIEALAAALAAVTADGPGTRLRPMPGLAEAVAPATSIAKSILGSATRAVRATLFDKTPERNWALGWHQDRTIAVQHKLATSGYGDWTTKSGITHVVPPFEILENMLTLRIHLDPAGMDNAPLLIAPGSHRFGRISEPEMMAVVEHCGSAACPARRGDAWVYATPILHGSARALRPGRRRVLQLLYSKDDLPNGLDWLGI